VKKATINVDPTHIIDEVSPLIFGGFIEHLGRCVYEGVYDPDSLVADEDGFRTDVMRALGELQMTIMRYPGGNFASGYHWEDGVGPQEQRPTVRELAWQSIETNAFGTDEFLKLCGKMGWEPMLAVNLGTGSPEEARNWVEYCNSESGTKYADQRGKNGVKEPHGVRYWCLGNEMDGPWQLGHVPAKEYAIRAQQAAKMMKDCDRSIEMVACGSSGTGITTFPEWDREVLEYIGTLAPYVSLHKYVGNPNDDPFEYFATGTKVDRQIETIDSTCRYVQAVNRSNRRHYLCFDEWNVWYKDMTMDGAGKVAPALIEEDYNFEDALVVGQFLNSFIRHADVVKIANIAQVVNVIAPLKTRGNELLKQTTFHAFRLFSERKSGQSLRLAVSGDSFDTDEGPVSCLDTSCIYSAEGNSLSLFMINLSPTDKMTVTVNLHGLEATSVTGDILHHADLKALNTFENPDTVVMNEFTEVSMGADLTAELPAASLVRLDVKLR
jgi:alpha-N-arabinofuranosidase